MTSFRSSKIERLLGELDWDSGTNAHANYSLGLLHWYPATFISNIPANLIEVFSDVSNVVWDPFCGSGNVGVEAIKRGRFFIGNDINGVAVRISQAKLAAVSRFECLRAEYASLRSELLAYTLKMTDLDSVFCDVVPLRGVQPHVVDELSRWYNNQVFLKLQYLYSSIFEREYRDEHVRNFFVVVFLSVARSLCAQQKSWGHIADNVKPNLSQRDARCEINPFSRYIERADKVLERVGKLRNGAAVADFSVQLSSAVCFDPGKEVDLVVTSPPYPWMCDYVTSQRLAYYWLGFDAQDVGGLKRSEIGARCLRQSASRSGAYVEGMISSFDNVIQRMRLGGLICIVYPLCTGDSMRARVLDDVYAYLESRVEKLHMFDRRPAPYRRSSPFTTLETERITVWRK